MSPFQEITADETFQVSSARRLSVRTSLRRLFTGALSPTTTLVLMTGFAFALRLVLVYFLFRDVAAPTWDHDTFGWEQGWTARSIFLGHGFSGPFQPLTGPTALVPPLYPYLLAGVFHIFGLYTATSAFVVLTLNAIFSSLTCIPLYLAMKDTLGARAAALAGWVWVIYPYALYFSAGRVWDYALTSLLFCICFYLAQRLHRSEKAMPWLLFGALFGVTALSNPSILTVMPVFLLMAMWRIYREGGRWLRCGFLSSIAFFAVLTPWTVRNHQALHIISPLRDGFWLEAYAGNHGDTSDTNPSSAHPASNPVEMKLYEQQGEVAYMATKKALTMDWVKKHPVAFTEVSGRRFVRFWTGYWSFSKAYLANEPLDVPDVFFCTGVTILMALGLRRFWRADRWTAFRYVALLALFPFPYYLTHASPDYRQPIEPAVVVLVSIGLFGIRQNSDSDDDDAQEDFHHEEEHHGLMDGVGFMDEPEFVLSQGLEELPT